MNPFTHIGRLIRHSATGPVRLPAPLSWRMLTRDPAAAVQRAILMEYLKTGSTTSRLLTLGIALLFWPFRTFTQAMRLTRQVGAEVSHIRSRPAQFFQQLWLAWFHGISPTMYYEMGIAASTVKHPPTAWLQAGHAGLLSRVFRKEKRLPELNDKAMFHRLMLDRQVPVAPTLGIVGAAEGHGDSTRAELLSRIAKENELFIKPVRGRGGVGARVLLRNSQGKWMVCSTLDAEIAEVDGFTDDELVETLAKSAGNDGWMVQQRVRNHPLIAKVCGGGLASVRVFSGLGDNGTCSLGALMCFPALNAIVSQGGWNSAIELENGVMGKVFRSALDQMMFAEHPETAVPVDGVRVPFWEELLKLVWSAHMVLDEYAFLGWDIAVTPQGPVVLEANGNYGTGAMQKPTRSPLIDDRFLSVFEYWIRKSHLPVSEPLGR